MILLYAVTSCQEAGTGWECARVSILTVVSIVVGVLGGLEVWLIWEKVGRLLTNQQKILYVAIIEMIVAVVHWGLVGTLTLTFVLDYLKQVQLVLICYFYSRSALRLLHRRDLELYLLWPIVGFLLTILTVALFLASFNVIPSLTSAPCTN